ncbi:uncharacterized protein LOC134224245 [Armigeres subalbatus]|uniref:uncharacterized protein LOC134224245 n=1 Tax=Armigeres subalbatus TaxID=124917 RepID=UPI002ED18873
MAVNMSTIIEPYRKGTRFGEWVERLEFYFSYNNVTPDARRACFITLGGPVIYHELKLLSPTNNLTTVSYEDMIEKLREKIIATWELAGKNSKNLNNDDGHCGQIAYLAQLSPSARVGVTARKLLATYNAARAGSSRDPGNSPRVSVKDRLGHKPYVRQYDDNSRIRNQSWRQTEKFPPWEWRQKPNYADMTCNFCGVKGHIKRKCFKLKNMQRETVNSIDTPNQQNWKNTS